MTYKKTIRCAKCGMAIFISIENKESNDPNPPIAFCSAKCYQTMPRGRN